MFDGVKRTLLIIDDLMHETNDVVSKLFTRVSHHKNVSVVYLTQNLFNNNNRNRTISLNAHYSTMQTNDSRACTLSADNVHAAFSVAHFLKIQSEYNVTAAWTRR